MVWILQEFRVEKDKQIEILLALPMGDEEEVDTACQVRMRYLYNKKLDIQGVRAINEYGEELFLLTQTDEQLLRHKRALERLRRSAQEAIRRCGNGGYFDQPTRVEVFDALSTQLDPQTSADVLQNNGRHKSATSSPAVVDYSLVLSRIIESIKDEAALIRNDPYEFPRVKRQRGPSLKECLRRVEMRRLMLLLDRVETDLLQLDEHAPRRPPID